MSLYATYILPRVIDFAMRDKAATQIRAEVIPRAKGVILELGIGSGLNLPFYSAAATRIFGVDPSRKLLEMARERAKVTTTPVELVHQSAEERLRLTDGGVDTVVVTWSLCSIPDPRRALLEARRVLRRSGELLFVEHGLAPDRGVRAWQNRFNPLWNRIGGGCNLNRKIDELIQSAGFEISQLKTAYLSRPRFLTFTYQGSARQT